MTNINENTQGQKSSKKKLILPVVLLLVVAGALSFGALRAQGEAKDGAPSVPSESSPLATKAPAGPDAWGVRCGEIKDGEKPASQYCEMVQSISVAQKDADPAAAQRLIEMAIGYPPAEKGKAFAAVILPLGILVNKDIVIEFDGDKLIEFQVAYCDGGGCVASFPLDGKVMEKLSNGSLMTVKSSAATGQPVAIEMSLAGFGKANEAVKSGKN